MQNKIYELSDKYYYVIFVLDKLNSNKILKD